MDKRQASLIVVIDDSATVRKIIEIALQREGYEIVSFPDGVEALRWFASADGRVPALLFLDVEMPKMNGYQVAWHLKGKAEYAQTVIVMISRRDGVIDRLKAKICGVREYFMKPFTTQDLLRVVSHYLGPREI